MTQIKNKDKNCSKVKSDCVNIQPQQDIPFWQAAGYTIHEWKLRQRFETMCSDNEKFSGYVSDFSEFEI